MKIYFSASRLYKEQYSDNYSKILKVLKHSNFEVLDNTMFQASPSGFDMPDDDRKKLYRGMSKNLDKADFCVFEASYPSTLHIGHEITLAMQKGKPVVVLYTKDHEPILFKGIEHEKVWWVEYHKDNLENVLSRTLEEAGKSMDVRFNFFVSPKILAYLDWVAQKRMIPRSVFLRNLIEKEMKNNKEFKSQ
ncbi:MAG: hypothetical protein WAV41_02695 [Microgenomates group bacterium]